MQITLSKLKLRRPARFPPQLSSCNTVSSQLHHHMAFLPDPFTRLHLPLRTQIFRVLTPTPSKTTVTRISGTTLKQTLTASDVVKREDEMFSSSIKEVTPYAKRNATSGKAITTPVNSWVKLLANCIIEALMQTNLRVITKGRGLCIFLARQ